MFLPDLSYLYRLRAGKDPFPFRKVSDIEDEIFIRETHMQTLAEEMLNPEALRDGARMKELQRQMDEEGSPFGILVSDINGLKAVNDTEGHKAGDEYIRSVSRLICRSFSHSPVFRIGGDEFVVIAQGQDYARIEKLLGKVSEHNKNAMNSGGVVVACGMARFEDDTSVSTVFKRADQNMYENKSVLKHIGQEQD